MREILFRGKTKDAKSWVVGSLVNTYDHYTRDQHCFIVDDDYEDHEETEVLPKSVGQYTGLTDKNGKKIFEGDIIINNPKYPRPTKYSVYMDEERGGYFPFACGDWCGCCEIEVVYYPKECEVVGNIHDNPELMEKEE
jgi:hypothetical protein